MTNDIQKYVIKTDRMVRLIEHLSVMCGAYGDAEMFYSMILVAVGKNKQRKAAAEDMFGLITSLHEAITIEDEGIRYPMEMTFTATDAWKN